MHSAPCAVVWCSSVRPSVCHVRVGLFIETSKHILKLISPSRSSTIPASLHAKYCGEIPTESEVSLNGSVECRWDMKQELSYRKQIARQLRTQYVEGIHRPKYYTVTLKSRLRVTQGHWKRNHWTDHTRLTISRVI